MILATLLLTFVMGGVLLLMNKTEEARADLFEMLYAGMLILPNLYAMAVLVCLLGPGLIRLPIFLWKHEDNAYNLVGALGRAERVWRAYRDALAEYHTKVSICKYVESKYRTKENSEYFDTLMEELPEYD